MPASASGSDPGSAGQGRVERPGGFFVRLAGALAPALACAAVAASEPLAPRILLVGDSTMATRTGYGDALCALFRPGVECVNLARGGRSTKSYRQDGSWDRVRVRLEDRGEARKTYVLVQFGHNDQPGKAERTTDLATEFPANIARYMDEIEAAGAVPVLVTPLARRTFRDGRLVNDLERWSDATRAVALARHVPWIDLNTRSALAVERMGEDEASTLANAEEFDRTHLGPRGAEYFARLVARELALSVPALAGALRPGFVDARTTRPQLTAEQAAGYSYAAVLARDDDWDPAAEARAAFPAPDFVVDAAAPGDARTFPSVQRAINAAVAQIRREGRTKRVYIEVRPGTYEGLLYVPEATAPITLYGTGPDPAATRIRATLDATMAGATFGERFGTPFADAPPSIQGLFASVKARSAVGTPGSAVAWVRNRGFHARNLTFENAHNKGRGDSTNHSQAVAMMVDDADRSHFERVRFIGFQDTLYLRASSVERPARVFLDGVYVEGDMDFIFGEATAYFRGSEIRSLGDRREHYVLAPSTQAKSRHGFVFERCRFTHDGSPHALAGRFKLARQWHRAAEAVGKVVLIDTTLGAHLDKRAPWADWRFPGSPQYRPVQYDSGGERPEPWLAEFRSQDE